MNTVRAFLEKNSVPEDACIFLDEVASPRNLRYLDLLHKESNELLPDAVIEVNGQPLIYLTHLNKLGSPASTNTVIAEMIRTLACRADARFLGVVTPGILTIYPIEISEHVGKPVATFDEKASSFAIRDFLSGTEWPDVSRLADDQWLDAFLLRPLNGVAETLREKFSKVEVSDANVISLIGRALFSRFLADREIVAEAIWSRA
jgi:hypothetical protein